MPKPPDPQHRGAMDDFDSTELVASFHTFGELLRHLRRRVGLTQRELGQAVGYAETHITRLERSQRRPDLTAVKGRFVPALGLQREPAWAQRLIELAYLTQAKSDPPATPSTATVTLAAPFARSIPTAATAAHPHPTTHPISRPASYLPSRPALRSTTNLPAPLTSFVGRERERAELQALLLETRLLTLIGAGGVGKSRLALEVISGMASQFAGGLWLVTLAAVVEPAFVASAVTETLRLSVQPGLTHLEVIVDFLASKQALLVLDNCEHVLSACAALVTTLLERCPQLRILVTSRETLHVPGEMVYRVPSLELPSTATDVPALDAVPAVQLFVSRARSAQSSFNLMARNAQAVVQICRRLDGIPLAIELAAAQTKMLTAEQIAARLDLGFHVLSDGKHTRLPQHQTLRATLDWSYQLLTEPERRLLCCLSIFAGSFTLSGAVQVVRAGPFTFDVDVGDVEDHTEDDIYQLLTHLTDKSLVIPMEHHGEVRYRLLGTIRQYGQEKLALAGDTDAVAEAHLHFAMAFAEAAQARLFGPQQASTLQDLDAEYDNLRAALDWALTHHNAEAGLRLAAALWPYWLSRAYSVEGRNWLDQLLSLPVEVQPLTKAKAVFATAALAMQNRNFVRCTQLAEAALDLIPTLDDVCGIALLHLTVAGAAALNFKVDQAAQAFEDSLKWLARTDARTDQRWILMLATQWYGFFLSTIKNIGRSVIVLQQSLSLASELGDHIVKPWILNALGHVALQRNDFAQANQLIDQARQYLRETGDTSNFLIQLNTMGYGMEMLGAYTQARSIYREVLQIRYAMNNTRQVAESLESLAGLMAIEGGHERAVCLLSHVAAIRTSLSFHVPSVVQSSEILAEARLHMDEQSYNAAWLEGQLMALDQAVAYALSDA